MNIAILFGKCNNQTEEVYTDYFVLFTISKAALLYNFTIWHDSGTQSSSGSSVSSFNTSLVDRGVIVKGIASMCSVKCFVQ